jgi:hypothetical protein
MNTAGLHPAFAAIFNAAARAPSVRLDVYRRGLQGFNWEFARIDDGRVYQRALERFDELLIEAAELDPDFALWNEIAPARFRNGHKALS